MEPNKSMQVQLEIRNNAEELQDYLRDLNNWEEDMKKKDEELRSKAVANSDLPPIRSLSSKPKAKKKKSKSKNGDVKKSKRIPSYDYNSWDKFDVDKALSEINSSQKHDSNSSEETGSSEDEEVQIMRMKQKAIVEKDRGNQYFKNGDYDMAIACYTSGIDSDSTNALLPANRAMALIKKGQFAAAEKDCDLSLTLDPTYVKAYHRRGTVRFWLKKYELAKEDFEKVLSFDSNNKEAKLEIDKIAKILADQTKQPQIISSVDIPKKDKTDANDAVLSENQMQDASSHLSVKTSELIVDHTASFENEEQEKGIKEQEIGNGEKTQRIEPLPPLSSLVTPIFIPPHMRSKKPLRRLNIEEVDSDSEEWIQFSEVSKEQSGAPIIIQKTLNSGNLNCNIGASGDSPEKSVPIPSSNPNKVLSPLSAPIPSSKPNKVLSPLSPTSPSLFPGIPATSYQFLSDWKALRHWPEKLCDYLKQIPPDRLPKIFQHSLESEFFSGILKIMAEYFIPREIDAFPYLKYLTGVERFSTLVMFLSTDDSKALTSLFHYIKSLKRYPDKEIQHLTAAYGLS